MTQSSPRSKSRDKSVEAAISRIDSMFGIGTLMRMDDRSSLGAIPVIPSGCLSIDLALGVGGIPRGRVTEIYGPESSGKTTLTLQFIAEAQRAGGVAAFIDAEHALDVGYAAKLGVDVPSLLVSQPDSGEQGLEITDILVRSGAVDIVVIDSVAALTPRSEIEGDMGDTHVGLQARLMSQALRKLTAAAARSHTAIVFINQLRMKIGVTFGSPETTTGGQALKFYSSVRIDIRRIGSIKSGDQVTANRARVKVVKNKVAPPFRQAEVELHFGAGICAAADLIEQGITLGQVQRAGSWFTWGDLRVQGRDALRLHLRQHPDDLARLRREVVSALGLSEGLEAASA
ncbi:MAG: recombinase RecA [Myxococcota bacterium]|nr:recombinase RecA [Myxococcota bacterium]